MLVSAAIFKASGEVAMVPSTTIEPRTIRGIQVAVPDEPMSISPAMVASESAGSAGELGNLGLDAMLPVEALFLGDPPRGEDRVDTDADPDRLLGTRRGHGARHQQTERECCDETHRD